MKKLLIILAIALIVLASCEDSYQKSASSYEDPTYLAILDTLASIDTLYGVGINYPDGTGFGCYNTPDANILDENGNRLMTHVLDRTWVFPEPDTLWIEMTRLWADESWLYRIPVSYESIDSVFVYRYVGSGDIFAQLLMVYLKDALSPADYEEYKTDL